MENVTSYSSSMYTGVNGAGLFTIRQNHTKKCLYEKRLLHTRHSLFQ